jgi:nitrogen regulatory protein PII
MKLELGNLVGTFAAKLNCPLSPVTVGEWVDIKGSYIYSIKNTSLNNLNCQVVTAITIDGKGHKNSLVISFPPGKTMADVGETMKMGFMADQVTTHEAVARITVINVDTGQRTSVSDLCEIQVKAKDEDSGDDSAPSGFHYIGHESI